MLVAVIALASCDKGVVIVVRAGQIAIAKATVEHWTSVMGGGPTKAVTPKRRMLRQRALGFLISSAWLDEEAVEESLKVSDQEVKRRLHETISELFPGGEVELRASLSATGRTLADVGREIRSQLVAAKLRQNLVSKEPPITLAQIAGYYRRHKRHFSVPERRYFDIDSLASEAAAERVRREVGAGKSFATMAFHEYLDRPRSVADVGAGKGAIERAVFSTAPKVLAGPVELYGDQSLFEVRRIVPASYRPLAQVEVSIRRQLAGAQRRRTLVTFIKVWRKKWLARTSCSPGYIVQKCSQYRGHRMPQDPVSFS